MRRSSLIVILCWLFAATIPLISVAADPLVPLPPQSPDTPWPTQDWPVGDPVDLDAVLDPIFATELGEGLGETRAVVVIRNGRLVHERYRDGYDPDTRHVSWSVAKSVTSALVGRAVQTGLIASVDDPMPAAFEPDDPRSQISWRHWLQMLDGLDYDEFGIPLIDNDTTQMMFGEGRYDIAAYAREHFGPAHTPGEHWAYSTAGMHLIARALQSLLPGTCLDPDDDPRSCRADPQVMKDWMDAVLFTPLGIDAVAEFDAVGTMLGGSNVYMSARDYARFGLLYLRGGVWDGEQLLPDGWVDFSRSNPATSDNGDYGAGFWPSPENPDNPDISFVAPFDAFHAGGRQGQIIWIVPSRDLIFVRNGNMPDTGENWTALFRLGQDVGAALE